MKVVVALAIFSACFATTSAAPGARSVDWSGMLQNSVAMRILVPNKYGPLIGVVYNDVLPDNPTVGERIELLLRADINRAVSAAERLGGHIKDQSLTLAQATRMVGDIVRIVFDTPRNMASELAQLSPEVEDRVRLTLKQALEETDALGKEIVAQLSQ